MKHLKKFNEGFLDIFKKGKNKEKSGIDPVRDFESIKEDIKDIFLEISDRMSSVRYNLRNEFLTIDLVYRGNPSPKEMEELKELIYESMKRCESMFGLPVHWWYAGRREIKKVDQPIKFWMHDTGFTFTIFIGHGSESADDNPVVVNNDVDPINLYTGRTVTKRDILMGI
jgi:hypothetical protein